MKSIQKAHHIQSRIARASLERKSAIIEMLENPPLHAIIQPYIEQTRNRLYGPVETLSMFATQALHADRSCQSIVNQAALRSEGVCSISTGGYCKARGRLDTSMVQQLTQSIGRQSQESVNDVWRWRGRDVYLVDGTTLLLPDTPANQKQYPQTSSLPEGVGFPICRAVGIVSLSTGALMDAAVSPFHGKGACEQSLLRSLLHGFKPGDVVLADAFYSTWFLINHMVEHQVDIVFVQHGARSRSTNFAKGVKLGKEDHLIELPKPRQKPDWMEPSDYESAPPSITIREMRASGKTLITTMTNPKTHPKKELGTLHKERWHIEVDLRSIKSTMGMAMLSCKSPEMAIKEMWVYFLAYNLLRSLMLSCALYTRVLPRKLSFKHTLQLLLAYDKERGRSPEKLWCLIAGKRIGERPGRIEPRVIKRRRNDYPLMMKPRVQLREEIRKNGHPKKVK